MKRQIVIGLLVALVIITGILVYSVFFRAGPGDRPTVIYFHAGG
jgi:hypothetical protein